MYFSRRHFLPISPGHILKLNHARLLSINLFKAILDLASCPSCYLLSKCRFPHGVTSVTRVVSFRAEKRLVEIETAVLNTCILPLFSGLFYSTRCPTATARVRLLPGPQHTAEAPAPAPAAAAFPRSSAQRHLPGTYGQLHTYTSMCNLNAYVHYSHHI